MASQKDLGNHSTHQNHDMAHVGVVECVAQPSGLSIKYCIDFPHFYVRMSLGRSNEIHTACHSSSRVLELSQPLIVAAWPDDMSAAVATKVGQGAAAMCGPFRLTEVSCSKYIPCLWPIVTKVWCTIAFPHLVGFELSACQTAVDYLYWDQC